MQPDTYPYKEYVQRTAYGKDWKSHVALFLDLNKLTLDEYRAEILEKFAEAGEPAECLDDINRIKQIQSVDSMTHDDAFYLTMLDFWLDKG